jgi:hypothetical protein
MRIKPRKSHTRFAIHHSQWTYRNAFFFALGCDNTFIFPTRQYGLSQSFSQGGRGSINRQIALLKLAMQFAESQLGYQVLRELFSCLGSAIRPNGRVGRTESHRQATACCRRRRMTDISNGCCWRLCPSKCGSWIL